MFSALIYTDHLQCELVLLGCVRRLRTSRRIPSVLDILGGSRPPHLRHRCAVGYLDQLERGQEVQIYSNGSIF